LSSASTAPASPHWQHKAQQDPGLLSAGEGVARPSGQAGFPWQPTADIQVNLAAAQRYGLRPGMSAARRRPFTSGLIVGILYEQSKIFDVVVWGASAAPAAI